MAKYLDQNGSKRLVDNVKTSHTALNTKINSEMVARENFATNVTSSISALDGRIDETSDYVKTIAVAGTTLSITSGAGDTTTFQTQDTTYDNATTSKAGLMSATDKAKLNGLSTYTLPTASTSTKGGVKIGSGLAMDGDTLNVTISGDNIGENVNYFNNKVTLGGGMVASGVSNNLSNSSIGAAYSTLDIGYGELKLCGTKINCEPNGISPTITGSPVFAGNLTFSGTPTLSGGFVSNSVSINADKASITGNQTFTGNPKFTGNPYFSGKPTLSGGFVSNSVASNVSYSTIDANHSSIDANVASIKASHSSINAYLASIDASSATITGNPTFSGNPKFTGNPTISGDPLFMGNPYFTGKPTLIGGFVARSKSIDMAYSTISCGNGQIYTKNFIVDNVNMNNATVNALTASIDAASSTINAFATSIAAGGASITGNPIFTGNPTLSGEVTFTKPIYIENINSMTKGALCFDDSSNMPRLRLRMNNVDYIFNCDTSVTAGSG